MIEFIQRLQLRYKSVQQADPSDTKLSQRCAEALKSLALAESLLLKEQLNATSHSLPLNLVIFGPTQAGKSTLVNCLIPEQLAGVSPLAGFTVHPQGFSFGQPKLSSAWLETVYPTFVRYEQEHLHPANYQSYSFSEIDTPSMFQNKQTMVVWDTPDFDSVDARGYIDGVLRTVGMADILILMVSKEKYADQTVWNMLKLLAPSQIPLVVCLNKLGAGEEQTLFRSFHNHFRDELPDAPLPVLVSLPFTENQKVLSAAHIIQALDAKIDEIHTQKSTISAQSFVEFYWNDWIEPLKSEIEDENAWQQSLDSSIERAMQTYKSEFLEHPDYYDTFQRAMAELLALLEVPGIGDSLGKAREVITWPVRKLIGFGKSVIMPEPDDSSSRDKNYEADLLRQLVDLVITNLANTDLGRANDEAESREWKKAFRRALTQSRSKVTADFSHQVINYQAEFEKDIQEAAQGLYCQLEEQPVLLNSLRATRVTTDAAAVVFALHSGGISLHDFILAPAMLSLSSMLAESSVGQYMNTVKARLKTRQYALVNEMLSTHLQEALTTLRDQAAANHRFDVSAEKIEEVRREFFTD